MELALAALQVQLAFGVAGWFFCLHRRRASLADAGFRSVRPAKLLLMVPVAIAVLVLNGVAAFLTQTLLGDVPTLEEQFGLRGRVDPSPQLILLAVDAVLVAPVVEEFLYRGLVLRYLRGVVGVTGAVAGSALLFSVAHLVPVLIAPLFVTGLVLGWLAQRYDSLYPSIVVHALINGAAVAGLLVTA